MSRLLENGSFAAFVGACSAFLLVMLTDYMRRRRTRGLLRTLVSDNLDHARNKIESVRTGIALLREDNKISNAPIMRFPIESIKNIQFQVLDMLSANENRATDAILYWMEAIDDLISEGTEIATSLKKAISVGASETEKQQIGASYIHVMSEAEKNLGHLGGLCESYVSGKYHEIVEFTHPIDSASDK